MEKIINYISRGQGLGIKFLLLFSLIVAVFYAVGTKFAGDQFFVPAAQKAADAFLPIRIENGIVTEPENTVKNYTFVLGEGKVPECLFHHRPSAGGRTSDQRDFTVTYSGIRFHIVLYENEENAIEKRKMDRFPAVTQGCLYGSTAGDADGKLRSLD